MSKDKPEGLTEEQESLLDKMTILQQGIAINTLKGMKPAEAHKAAGGKSKNEANRHRLASEILTNPYVSEFIAISRHESAIEAQIDATFILTEAKYLYDRLTQKVAPALTKGGEKIRDEDGNIIYHFDAKNALAALKLMGEHVDVSAFKKVVEHNAGEGVVFNMSFGGKDEAN